MNTDLETIEQYLTGQLPADERTRFETALRTDPALADATAFYLLTRQVARQEAREQRRTELDALRTRNENVPTRPLWSAPMRWAAAASIAILLGLGWYFVNPSDSTMMASRLADEYVTEQYKELPLTMSGGSSGSTVTDRLKTGVDLYNKGKLAQAEVIFGDVLAQQPDNDSALKYAGIVALRQRNYDKAISLFQRLSQQTDLVGNPGTFLEAIALLQRNRPLDKEQAKKLLEDVISRNLEGKRQAETLLDQL